MLEYIFGMETIGERVKQARLLRGLTQKQLAQLIGRKQQTIQLIESNETKHSRYLLDIADALNVRYLWLLKRSGSMGLKLSKDKELLLSYYDSLSEANKQRLQDIAQELARLEGQRCTSTQSSHISSIPLS